MLFLISTPIGNLADFSHRAIEVLQSCDLILCEDTRHSKILLSHYDIRTRCLSYHKFNEAKREERVIELLKEGRRIALLSDAGTPTICDPGERLVKKVIEEGIETTHIPGACALITALVLSGFDTAPFQFVGFAPKKAGRLKEACSAWQEYPGVTVLYAPTRELSKIFASLTINCRVAICKELTKKHERILRGTVEELKIRLAEDSPKGECVVLIKGEKKKPTLSLEEHLANLMREGLSRNEAIKAAASDRGLARNEVYKIANRLT